MDGRKIVRNWLFQLCLNGTLATETFVFVSGFMTSVCFLRYLEQHSSFPRAVGLLLAVRLWRTVPVALLAIMIAIVSPLLNSGPVWREMMVPAADNCRHHWLATAFFVSNFAVTKPEDAVSPISCAASFRPVPLSCMRSPCLSSLKCQKERQIEVCHD